MKAFLFFLLAAIALPASAELGPIFLTDVAHVQITPAGEPDEFGKIPVRVNFMAALGGPCWVYTAAFSPIKANEYRLAIHQARKLECKAGDVENVATFVDLQGVHPADRKFIIRNPLVILKPIAE